jgi:hypothetical protein
LMSVLSCIPKTHDTQCSSFFFFFFFFQFSDVASVASITIFFKKFFYVEKMAIIHKKMWKTWRSSTGRFSQIWLQTTYDVQNFNHPSISLAPHSKPNVTNWRF